MKYIHRYHDFESFIKDYGNDSQNVEYIVVSGITLNFECYYDDGSNCCDWGNDDGYWAETYVGRNPSVGDEVDFFIPGAGEGELLTIDEVDSHENKYIEPWVSYCDEPGGIEELTVDCHGDGQYLYGARFNRQDGDLYKWDSFQLVGGDRPGYDQYWTRSRNPQPGDPIFCSINGAQEDYRCATAGAPIKQYPEVVYNKKSNWIKVEYSAGSSDAYVNIIEWGNGFDNSENSEYYVYCNNTGEETMYQGVRLYWDQYRSLYIDEIPCYTYYYIAEFDGEWVMMEDHQDC